MTTSPLRVGVTGARGRMGAAVVEAVLAAPEMELAAALDIGDSLDELVAQSCDVVIDFTTPDAVMGNLEFAIGAGMHCVVGTTGFDDERLARVKEWTAGHPGVGVLIAPNFSIGAVVMMHLSARAARYFESVEIVEMHHKHKVDAPSGTALSLGEAAARGRDVDFDSEKILSREGITGVRELGKIGFATLRGGDVVGEHSVIFAGAGERIELTHRATDRGIFARGAVRAARWTQARDPGFYAMADVLGLDD